MDSRSLNRIVSIQSPTATQDAAGQPIPTWATSISVWANIRHLSGIEGIKADSETSTVKASIRIKRGPTVSAAMRVVHGSTTYRILAVLPDEVCRDKIDLVCEVVHG